MNQFFSPEFWKAQLAVVTSALWLILPLLAAVAIFVWWLRGTIAKGQIDALKDQLGARDERLLLAQEKERDVRANSPQRSPLHRRRN